MATLTTQTTAPRLSRSAFWDIDLNTLDLKRHGDFAIIRIFERGTPGDIQEIINYFGKPRIARTLLKASSLQPRAVSLGMKLLGLSPNQFTCLKPSQRVTNYSRY